MISAAVPWGRDVGSILGELAGMLEAGVESGTAAAPANKTTAMHGSAQCKSNLNRKERAKLTSHLARENIFAMNQR